MPDYIYLLENRLSVDQQHALRQLRATAREARMLIFLTGDAVRDLTSGHGVRELEVAVQGNALKLKKKIEKIGGHIWGEDEVYHALYLCFPGTVRVDVVSTHRAEHPKPGKAVFHAASIQEDLRRRDFTANAMAISLNEGSFGLLMDPLNGAADIESRTLRLVSNYGFLEQPSLLLRATRYKVRLDWEMDPRTQVRYESAKNEGVIEHLPAQERSRELEQIGHEEEALQVLEAMEAEGWMKVLFGAWTAAKADREKLAALRELAVELLMQGVHADMSAAQMQLLTAKLSSKELAALKKLMLRPGFVEEWNNLDVQAAAFAKVLMARENAKPSAGYRLFMSYDPEAVLWLGFTSKNQGVQERYQQFLKAWPEVRQQIPYALMQEMRITQELSGYTEIVNSIFLELIDGRLSTPEEMRAFLEPHSPPAPPPQATVKRTRTKRSTEARVKEHLEEDEEAEDGLEDEELEEIGDQEEEIDLELRLPKIGLKGETESDEEGEETEAEEEEERVSSKAVVKPVAVARAEARQEKKAAEKKAAAVEALKTGQQPGKAKAKTTQQAAKAAAPVSAKGKTAPTKKLPIAASKPGKSAPPKPVVKKPVSKVPLKAAAKRAAKATTVKGKPAPKAASKPSKPSRPPAKGGTPAAKKAAQKSRKKR